MSENPHNILTHTGLLIDLRNPTPDVIDIEDIAHALAHVNRFTGHTRRPMSVAEHSVLVSLFVPEVHALEALMHDASEAYLGDVSSPLKSLLPEYQQLEAKWQRVIEAKFGLAPMGAAVKEADRWALDAERNVLLEPSGRHIRFGTDLNGREAMEQMLQTQVFHLSTSTHKSNFLQRFYKLVAERALRGYCLTSGLPLLRHQQRQLKTSGHSRFTNSHRGHNEKH